MATFVGFSTSASSTTVSVPAPGGVALNDQLVIYVSASTAATTFSSTGWSAATAATGQNCSAGFLYKTANSSDVTLSAGSGSYTLTASGSVRMAGQIADLGQGALDPIPTTAGSLIGAASTSFTPVNGPTSVNNNDLIVFFACARDAALPVATISVDPGYAAVSGANITAGQVNSTATGACVGVYAATKGQANAGAVPNGTVTWSGSSDGGGLLITVTRPGAKIRHVGAALGNSNSNGDTTAATFLSTVANGRLKVLHPFYGGTVPASVAAAPNPARDVTLAGAAGVYRVWIDFELTHYGITGTYNAGGTPAAGAVTDAAKLDTFIGQCQAAGVDVRISLWHEPYDKFNIYGTQAQNNLDYTNSVGYYGAVLRKYGLPVTFDPSNYSVDHDTRFPIVIGTSAAPGLGWAACAAGYIDEIYTDFYPNEKNSGSTPAGSGIQGTLDGIANLADTFGLPLGILELGPAPATNAVHWNDTDIQTFLQYVLDFLSTRATANKPIADIVMWATNDNATQAGMYLVTGWSSGTLTKYRSLFDTYDGGNYGGTGISNSITGVVTNISVDAPAGTLTTTVNPTNVGGSTAHVTVAAPAGIAVPITNSPFMLPKPVVYPLSGFTVTISSVSSAFWSDWNVDQTASSITLSEWNDVIRVAVQAPLAWNNTQRLASLTPLTSLGSLCMPIVHPIDWYFNPSGITWNDDTIFSSRSRKMAWRTNQRRSSQKKIRWMTNINAHSSESSAWKVRQRVQHPIPPPYNFYVGVGEVVMHPITYATTINTPLSSWNDNFRVHHKGHKIAWNTCVPVVSKKSTAWNTQTAHVFKTGASAWFITQRVTKQQALKWNTAQRTLKKRKIAWKTKQAIVSQKATTWNFTDKVRVLKVFPAEYSLATMTVHPISYYKSVSTQIQWNIAQRISSA